MLDLSWRNFYNIFNDSIKLISIWFHIHFFENKVMVSSLLFFCQISVTFDFLKVLYIIRTDNISLLYSGTICLYLCLFRGLLSSSYFNAILFDSYSNSWSRYLISLTFLLPPPSVPRRFISLFSPRALSQTIHFNFEQFSLQWHMLTLSIIHPLLSWRSWTVAGNDLLFHVSEKMLLHLLLPPLQSSFHSLAFLAHLYILFILSQPYKLKKKVLIALWNWKMRAWAD